MKTLLILLLSKSAYAATLKIIMENCQEKCMKCLGLVFTVMTMSQTAYCFENNFNDERINKQVVDDLSLLHSIKQSQISRVQGSFLVVGGEFNGCDFDNIQAAIDSATVSGVSEIRIASNKLYQENLIIDNINIDLVGGYDSCFNAGQTGPGSSGPGNFKVEIDGSGALLPALRITGASQRNTVVLRNLSFVNGTGSGLQTGGGINAYDANTQILMDNVGIDNNTGSGLGILGGPNTNDTDILMTNTLISNNTAGFGGGISCSAGNGSIILGSGSGVALNTITNPNGLGGGAYIAFNCTFSMYSAEMVSNSSLNHGGGIFVGSGATAFLIGRKVCDEGVCLGDDENPVFLNGNKADFDLTGGGNGGAIHIENSFSFVAMSQVWIRANSAFNGGAVSLNDNAVMLIDRESKTCWNSGTTNKCNLIELNSTNEALGNGGAIYNNDSQVELRKSYVENNRADFGTAVSTIGNTATTLIYGSVFSGNGNPGVGTFSDEYVIRAAGGAEYIIDYSTFVDNHAAISVFGISNTQNSKLTLRKSIVDDSFTGEVLNDNFGTATFDCVLAHEINSITGTQLFVGDPGFVDRIGKDFHLDPSISEAVDLCVDSGTSSFDVDLDFRGFDDPTVANQGDNPAATYDAGADETYATDIIFENGFE